MPTSLKDILAEAVSTLRAIGYKGSGQNYRRVTDEAVSVINFQKSSGGKRFYVNVGVQPLFVPTECESQPDVKKIREPECIFRRRLAPPDGELLGWPYTTEFSSELARRLDELCSSFVVPLTTIPGPITQVSVDDFPTETPHPLLGGRHARNFLHFARILQSMGNHHRAAEFATAAIDMCPPEATSLLHHLEQALAKATS